MTMNEYLEKKDLTSEQMAILCNLSSRTIENIRMGYQPGTKTVLKIIKATNGIIDFKDLVRGIK